jgi:hypothetical protein
MAGVDGCREAYVPRAEMTEHASTPPTPAEQKEIVKSGCMTVVAWIVMIASFGAVFFGAEWMMAKIMAPPPGPDVIDFGCAKCIAKQLTIGALFTFMLLLAAVAIVKHFGQALLVTAAIAGFFAYFNWYRPFQAIAFQRDRVELHYLWPRPSVVLNLSDIVSTERVVSTQVRGEGGSDFRYAVEIKTKTGSYISMDVGGESPVQAARDRIGKKRPPFSPTVTSPKK